ncbi:MAG: hypothetical protein ABTR92_11955 [Candidatus Accumulibacter phosphatis]
MSFAGQAEKHKPQGKMVRRPGVDLQCTAKIASGLSFSTTRASLSAWRARLKIMPCEARCSVCRAKRLAGQLFLLARAARSLAGTLCCDALRAKCFAATLIGLSNAE